MRNGRLRNWNTSGFQHPKMAKKREAYGPKLKNYWKQIHHFYFLYVDDGAMLFINREDLEAGTTLLFSSFARYDLEMHIRCNAKASNTECMKFPAYD